MSLHRAIGCAILTACWAPSLLAQGAALGKSWPTATPAAVGLNASVLDSLDTEIREGRYGHVDRMLVIRHGRVAYERSYPHDYDAIYGQQAKTPSAVARRVYQGIHSSRVMKR